MGFREIVSAPAIERLTASDVPKNVALSRSVGWPDVEGEWRVLHDAAEVLGIRSGEQLLAQGALGDYGTCATLAKMVVAGDAQGRGLGGRMLDDFLARADARGVPVGLCATELGRPLYVSRRFQVTGQLVILVGTPELGTSEGGAVVPLLDAESAVRLDRRFSGCDRSRMLRARYREASGKVVLSGGEGGFGLASNQDEGSLVGPILAETERGAQQLALALFAQSEGPVRINVPSERVAFRQWLISLGLEEKGERVEMGRGVQRLPWQVEQRFALATQAWG
jgi:GNAT superfamily N-acetyltransferase